MKYKRTANGRRTAVNKFIIRFRKLELGVSVLNSCDKSLLEFGAASILMTCIFKTSTSLVLALRSFPARTNRYSLLPTWIIGSETTDSYYTFYFHGSPSSLTFRALLGPLVGEKPGQNSSWMTVSCSIGGPWSAICWVFEHRSHPAMVPIQNTCCSDFMTHGRIHCQFYRRNARGANSCTSDAPVIKWEEKVETVC